MKIPYNIPKNSTAAEIPKTAGYPNKVTNFPDIPLIQFTNENQFDLIRIIDNILTKFQNVCKYFSYLPIAIVNPILNVQSRIPILMALVSGVDMSEAYE